MERTCINLTLFLFQICERDVSKCTIVQWAGKDDYIGEGTPAIPLGIDQVSREGGDRQTGRYDQNMIRRKVVFPTYVELYRLAFSCLVLDTLVKNGKNAENRHLITMLSVQI